MNIEAITFSRRITGQGAGQQAFAKSNYQNRLHGFIEHTDWDEVMIAQDGWIDKLCIGVIIVASLYFIPPALVVIFMG
jgi:hypothetical protein